jgi:Tol biopolymer transport system component
VTALALATSIGIFVVYKFLNRSRPAAPASTEALQVLRTTKITFSPGLDQFPSLSPDGNSIAYSSDQNGSFEIYMKQLTPGAGEIQLTSDKQENSEPAWSPDGQRIAFYSKGRKGIWVMPALGGSAKQLTEFGSCPAWSRDGSMIAFQSGAPADIAASNSLPPSTIWVIPSQGGTPRQITKQGTPQGGHGNSSWSPDGKRIVFDARDFVGSSVWSVSVGGGELKKITTNGARPIYAPDGQYVYVFWWGGSSPGLTKIPLSPMGEPTGEPVEVGPRNSIAGWTISADGKRIAYSAITISSNLWSVSLSPGSGAAAGLPELFTHDTSLRNNLARFSPDGRKLALTRWRIGTSGDIWVADADGKNLTQLTTNPTTDNQPSWFPDSQRIAFLSDRNNNHLTLWSISLASGKEESLLDLGEGVEFAVLSPNGEQVAFNSKKSGTINVWTAPMGGGEAKQLTFDNELAGFPCWSPDGKFLAFELKRGDDNYLEVMPSEGGTPEQLVSDHGLSWPHDWSPDGDKIAFAGRRNGIWNIYWVSRSTKKLKQLTNYSTLKAFVRYPAWSPLGNRIVYEYAETTGNIWLMELK